MIHVHPKALCTTQQSTSNKVTSFRLHVMTTKTVTMTVTTTTTSANDLSDEYVYHELWPMFYTCTRTMRVVRDLLINFS